MISKESVTNLLLVMSRFMTKKGADMESRRELAAAIGNVIGENSLDAIYINNTDNVLLPDVAVLHLYNTDFSRFILDPDSVDTCPYGYTIEIHQRCFEKYTEEELTAVILHDILQNVQSDTAKIRFLKAYTAVTSKHDTTLMLDLFDDISLSEVTFMGFTAICLRPLRVPVEDADYVATDEVLKAVGLGDAYDSYLNKVLPMSTMTVDDAINKELKQDYHDVNTIINACLDRTVRHYYNTIRTEVPLVTLDHILTSRQAVESIGFVSRKKQYARRHPIPAPDNTAIAESFSNPKDEYEIRFQIDKIINSMRYAETEAEREVILFKIKQLSLKLLKTEQQLTRRTNDKYMTERLTKIREFRAELDELRDKVMKMEIKVKRWSVYVKDAMPEGYNF